MNASDDDLDNLLRNHLAAELDPMRRQAGRAFAREVTGPMNRRLRINAWADVCRGVRDAASRRVRPVAAMAGAMAAAAALGFFVPRWLTGPAAGPEIAEARPAGAVGPREWQTRVETANFVDPQTHARTEFYVFPHDQEVAPPVARQ